MSLTLCKDCLESVDAAIQSMALPTRAEEQHVRAFMLGIVRRFPGYLTAPIPEGTCGMCYLQHTCTCGKGPDCHYARWADIVAEEISRQANTPRRFA